MVDAVEFEIFVPSACSVEGHSAYADYERYKQSLLERFGGLTVQRMKNEGYWKVGGHVTKDELIIWRVIDENSSGFSEMVAVKEAMEKSFRQEQILVVLRAIKIL